MTPDVDTLRRINAGYRNATVLRQDGNDGHRIDTFSDAMAHEICANHHKGEPDAVSASAHAAELLYHAAKLVMAIRYGHRAAVLEYAADCGNHAWMAASSAGVLDLDLLTEGLEGMPDASSGLYDPPIDGEVQPVNLDDPEVQRKLREQPWIYRREFTGFYEQLKELAVSFGAQLDDLVKREAAAHGRDVPAWRDALGFKDRAFNPEAEGL